MERNDPGGRGPNPWHRYHPGSDRSTGRGDNVDPEEIQYASHRRNHRAGKEKTLVKKHWLATPKPFIAWGIFMGLMTGGAFAVRLDWQRSTRAWWEQEQPAWLLQPCSHRPSPPTHGGRAETEEGTAETTSA